MFGLDHETFPVAAKILFLIRNVKFDVAGFDGSQNAAVEGESSGFVLTGALDDAGQTNLAFLALDEPAAMTSCVEAQIQAVGVQ